VQQESFFNDSILDNIRYGHSRRRWIRSSPRGGHAWFISKLPNGYDTKVAAPRVVLRGQKQRISIASRFANPTILCSMSRRAASSPRARRPVSMLDRLMKIARRC
jgi:ABC-type transport system involved in Fe-S cluster assembly fused permease/ATPase subunit